ncbi:MAG TPA: EAL domain-containing protein [Vicinamibacteria bacterium]|jgi:diguanylate cyclase (GGDEF)-like protein/PAS domain S-box-containing protein|nr:EAL domain-containing protein [Vicinamibacteria bacterium]
MKTLVFETDDLNRRRLEAGIRARGHSVTSYLDADAAWEAYAAEGHPLLIIDGVEPHGLTLCRRIRASPNGGRSVILACGLSRRPAELEGALLAGADDLLPKPADAGTLDARLAVAEARVRHLKAHAGTEHALRRLQKALEALPLGVTISDTRGTILYLNPSEAEMHGYRVEELLGENLRILSPPEAWKAMTPAELGQVRKWKREHFRRRKDGSLFLVELLSDVVTDAGGNPVGMVTLCEDITERRRAEQALRESEERYILAVRGANDGLWDWNLKTDEVDLSPRWKEMLGYEEEEIGRSALEWVSRIHPDDVERVKAKMAAHLSQRTPRFEDEHRMRGKDGSYRWVLVRGYAVRDAEGRPYRMTGAQTDVTDRRTYDPLTGLPNRALFMERLSQAVARSRRGSAALFAVLFIDLDRFKAVNDTLGHLAGDQLLVAVGRRLEACLRPGDAVGRFGGDEFAILVEPIKDVSDATRVAERVLRELARPHTIEGREVVSSASVGIALSVTGYEGADDILRDADAAMSRAKALGRGRFELFDETMRERAIGLLQLEGDLRRAIERGELRVDYQPIVSLASKRLDGFEALLRWQHPERGLLLPADFLPLAETTGLIVPIGIWVLREACARAQSWGSEIPLTVNVNVSARQLANPEFVRVVRGILAETGLSPTCLRLEISEEVFLDGVSTVLGDLHLLGVRLGLDDFGTGRSTLASLRHSPVDTLKLDRSFVTQLGADEEGGALVRGILGLAHGLGLSVVAEGVENGAQAARLTALDCEAGQGHYFSRPVDAEAAGGMVAAIPRLRVAPGEPPSRPVDGAAPGSPR